MTVPPIDNVNAELPNKQDRSSTNRTDRNESQTVLRACCVLRAFHSQEEELLLNDVIGRTNLPKTTVFRLLRTLVHGGLVERSPGGIYSSRFGTAAKRPLRIGFAAQGDFEFSHEVMRSLEKAAAREHVQLITVDNRYSAREAVRNADLLIREQVDLVLEFQTYERVAPVLASKFLESNTPVIAIEIPHPGASYFGANNYKAGLIGGKALGRWVKENWEGRAEQIVLLELPIAGSLVELRGTGMMDGLRAELPNLAALPVAHLNGSGGPEKVLEVLRQYLRRARARRTLVCAVNDICALAAVRAFEEAGRSHLCAVVGQNAIREARLELRRQGSRLIGTVAYFPERYGDEIIPLAISILRKKPVPAAVFVKHQLITPRNVDLIYPLDNGAGRKPVGESLNKRDRLRGAGRRSVREIIAVGHKPQRRLKNPPLLG